MGILTEKQIVEMIPRIPSLTLAEQTWLIDTCRTAVVEASQLKEELRIRHGMELRLTQEQIEKERERCEDILDEAETWPVAALLDDWLTLAAEVRWLKEALAGIPCLEYGFIHELSDPPDATCGKCVTCLARQAVAKREKERIGDSD